MSTFDDGCTAGPLSESLNALIHICCKAHDAGLDHTTDFGTFIVENVKFIACVGNAAGWGLALIVAMVVCGPLGMFFYLFGPKRPKDNV